MNGFRSIYASDLSHRAKSVYMYLKDRADSEGRCWPAIKTIALELGLSRSTVKRALDDLVRAGLLRKDPRWRENGSYTSNPVPDYLSVSLKNQTQKSRLSPPGGESAF